MSNKRVADVLVDTLVAAGVKNVSGLAGDSLNGITDSIRPRDNIRWIPVRHEETAAFPAGAEAHLTGRLAVCAGSCAPGNLHLINGLNDCHRSRAPVLAIAAQIPSAELGSSYFQETRPESLFRECSHDCELISWPEQMPRVLEIAIQTAISKRGVAVVALPGDIGLQPAASHRQPRLTFPELVRFQPAHPGQIACKPGCLSLSARCLGLIGARQSLENLRDLRPGSGRTHGGRRPHFCSSKDGARIRPGRFRGGQGAGGLPDGSRSRSRSVARDLAASVHPGGENNGRRRLRTVDPTAGILADVVSSRHQHARNPAWDELVQRWNPAMGVPGRGSGSFHEFMSPEARLQTA
jgi:hypothetical protein